MDHAQRLSSSNSTEKQSYSRRHFDWIALTARAFFGKHPGLLTDEGLEILALGEASRKIELFGHIKEFYPLIEALEGYCDFLQAKPKREPLFGFMRGLIRWKSPQIAPNISYKPAPVNN